MAIFNSELLVCQRALTGMVGMIFPLYPHLGWLKKKTCFHEHHWSQESVWITLQHVFHEP